MRPLQPHSTLAVVYRTLVYAAVMMVLVALAGAWVTDGYSNFSHWSTINNWQKAGESASKG